MAVWLVVADFMRAECLPQSPHDRRTRETGGQAATDSSDRGKTHEHLLDCPVGMRREDL